MIPKILFLHSELRTYRIPFFSLLAKNFNVTFGFTVGLNLSSRYPETKGWQIVNFPGKKMLGYGSDVSWELITYIIKNRKSFDCIFASEPASFPAHVSFLLSRLFDIPFLLFTETWMWPTTFWTHIAFPFVRMMFRQADGILCAGSRSRAFAVTLGVNKNKLFDVPNSCDDLSIVPIHEDRFADFKKRLNPESRFCVLFLGRMIPVKDPLILVQAAEFFQRKHIPIQFILCGNGPLLDSLRQYTKNKRLQSVVFCDDMNENDRVYYHRIADVLVLSGKLVKNDSVSAESWGMVINEALSLSKPVIASSTVGASDDLIINNKNGFIIPPDDTQALVEAIQKLASNKKRVKEFGEISRNQYLRHSPRAQFDGFDQALKIVLQR